MDSNTNNAPPGPSVRDFAQGNYGAEDFSTLSNPLIFNQHDTSVVLSHPSTSNACVKNSPFISPPRALTKEVMLDYLRYSEKYSCTLRIFHAKVAQKSYGNEKRFFCPPPSVYLVGAGWDKMKQQFDQAIDSYLKAQVGYGQAALREQLTQTRSTDLNATIGIIGSKYSEPQSLDFSNGRDFSPAKNLYISDQDKRKYFHLNVELSLNVHHNLGGFKSDRIKVISKPSKKKQSVKGNDTNYLCVTSGTKVGLFNRLRSQTVSTRYLHVENDQFHASSTKWGAFKIHLVNSDKGSVDSVTFDHRDGYVYYGSVVKLVDSCSDLALPRLRIRKADKNNVIVDEGNEEEPVSQLHRVAFQIVDDSNQNLYLGLVGEKIVQHKAEISENGLHQVGEGAAWTIISTEKVEYTFYEAMGPSAYPLAPIPVVDHMNITARAAVFKDDPGNPAYITLRGSEFYPGMEVWLGPLKTVSTYTSLETIEAVVPTVEDMFPDINVLYELFHEDGQIVLPVLFVRDDGVIYDTDCSFSLFVGDKPDAPEKFGGPIHSSPRSDIRSHPYKQRLLNGITG